MTDQGSDSNEGRAGGVGDGRDLADDPWGVASSFRFAYDPPVLRFGEGSVATLSDELAERGLERALVVCGETVGSTAAVMDPVRDGLGDRLAAEFPRTTPEKHLATALAGRDALRAVDADAIVGVGGGSSLDTATLVSALAAADRPPAELATELAETGSIAVPDGSLTPVVAVPTTFAGAELSTGAGVTLDPGSALLAGSDGDAAAGTSESPSPSAGAGDATAGSAASGCEQFLRNRPVAGGVSDPRLRPAVAVYDTALFATTPRSILAGSAMNGFDKGIEALYAPAATPVTDATASRGLGMLHDSLPVFGGEGQLDPTDLAPIVAGTLLVQYGVSRPDATTLSLVHAFGHGLSRGYDVQQGVAHAAVVSHVLAYTFEHADARRATIADALGVAGTGDPAAAVVGAVEALVAALDVPTRLRELEGPRWEELADVAVAIRDDPLAANAPDGLDPTVEEIEGVLRAAW